MGPAQAAEPYDIGWDFFYAFFLEGFAAVGAVQDEGGSLAVCVVEDPLYLDRGEGCTGVKGFGISADGLPAFIGPGIDGCIPCQVFDFHSDWGSGFPYCGCWGVKYSSFGPGWFLPGSWSMRMVCTVCIFTRWHVFPTFKTEILAVVPTFNF